jgi:hypothetical protein
MDERTPENPKEIVTTGVEVPDDFQAEQIAVHRVSEEIPTTKRRRYASHAITRQGPLVRFQYHPTQNQVITFLADCSYGNRTESQVPRDRLQLPRTSALSWSGSVPTTATRGSYVAVVGRKDGSLVEGPIRVRSTDVIGKDAALFEKCHIYKSIEFCYSLSTGQINPGLLP